ncbi:ABC transporter ATP-binding protein [Gulosibacter sp. ACHW.36C]|uniref:ABC transporter ATP-binding protein/permease n=1 Tax=Gulosibacter sediminis TaxID=1729695 RepID=A0ABY4MZ01_9MICO|nr:ABC transporter ATP-binding protein [Gulosibacter sediminis]UQN14438.1 ABC transporter ATP-binding protein/permease [Gulosibacter sediminis]
MLLKLLGRYLRPHLPLVIGVLVFQLLQAFAMLYIPTLNADIINNGVAKGDVGYIWQTGGVMLLVAIGQLVCILVATYCSARAAMSVGRDLRRDVFDHVAGFSEREVAEFGAGSLITRSTNDVQQVQMLVFMGALVMVSAPMLAIGGVVMAIRQSIELSWVIAVAVPVLLILMGIIVGRMIPLFGKLQDRLDGINRVMREQLTGIRVVRAFVREDIERRRFGEANDNLADVGRRVGNLFVIVFPGAMLIMEITSVGVVWFGGHLVDAGTIEVGALIAYISYTMQILMGVIMVSFMTTMIPRASVCATRISEVLATDTSLKFPKQGIAQQPTPGRVEFDNVTFAYPGADKPVLSDINFTAEPGQTVAVIGSTGSGKTTLANLIPRLFDVTGGEVRVGGVPVREADASSLWDSIGYVPQRPYLFAGTVASNLEVGLEGASEEDMWWALRVAQADDFVSEMPGQLEASIAQGGTNVSGGQRQRLSIARALIRKPKLLVFDDSFSALDLTTDARLREALWQELPQTTKFVVAQRVSTITEADRIIVLDGGRIVGDGTHEQLLADNPTYQEIVESQLGAEATR